MTRVSSALVTKACARPVVQSDAPGVLELDASGKLLRWSSSAEPLLSELSGTTAEAGVRSASVQALASATRAGVGGEPLPGSALPSSAIKTPAGSWLMLHGGR